MTETGKSVPLAFGAMLLGAAAVLGVATQTHHGRNGRTVGAPAVRASVTAATATPPARCLAVRARPLGRRSSAPSPHGGGVGGVVARAPDESFVAVADTERD